MDAKAGKSVADPDSNSFSQTRRNLTFASKTETLGSISSHALLILTKLSVADPGFPRGGDANPPGGVPTHDFAKCSQKLHEIERIWTPGGMHPSGPSLDPPMIMEVQKSSGA